MPDRIEGAAKLLRRLGVQRVVLPGVDTFVNRLRAHSPTIEAKHTSKGNFWTGFRIKHTDDDPLGAEFPFQFACIIAGEGISAVDGTDISGIVGDEPLTRPAG